MQCRAVVIKEYGGPEVLTIESVDPQPQPGHVLIEVKAFGLNHAEIYFRKGAWGEVAEISGIECVGIVKADPDGRRAEPERRSRWSAAWAAASMAAMRNWCVRPAPMSSPSIAS